MAEFQNTNLKVLIANSTDGATETDIDAFDTSADNGEVIAVESDGSAIAAGSDKIAIVSKKEDGTLDFSENIKVKDIKKISAKSYTAPTERTVYVGYDGSSGSIEEINDNLYQLNLEFYDYGAASNENRYRKQAHYESGSSAAQETIAEGIVASLFRNFSREPNRRIKSEVVTSASGSAVATDAATSATIKFTNGSKYVTGFADVDGATGGTALAAGTYLRIGTTVTDPVYRIVNVDTTNDTLELATPFQGETVLLDDTDLNQVASADVTSGDCGIKVTGLPADYQLGKDVYEKIDFRLSLVDFGDTDKTVDSSATEGLGVGKRVADAEWFAKGNFGELYRTGEPKLYNPEFDAVITNNYDVITVEYIGETVTAFNHNPIPRRVDIYCNAGNGTDHTNANVLITDLDTLSDISVSTL